MKMNDELKWKLQLFAEDLEGEPEDKQDANEGGDDSKTKDDEPETKGEKKYSDEDVDNGEKKEFVRRVPGWQNNIIERYIYNEENCR